MARRAVAKAQPDPQLVIEFDVPDDCHEISVEAIRALPTASKLQVHSAVRALGYELTSVRDADSWWTDELEGYWIRVKAKGGLGNG